MDNDNNNKSETYCHMNDFIVLIACTLTMWYEDVEG